MSDNLKNLVDQNRSDFEVYPFNEVEGLENILPGIIAKERWNAWKVIGMAACFLFVLLGSVHQMRPVDAVSSELAEMEQYYNGEINQKISLVRTKIGDDAVLKDLEAMDQAFYELKSDLKDNVDNEEVIAAMMKNYQLKLQILEEILRTLEEKQS